MGVGPKGLFALERLLAHAVDLDRALDVHLFDPTPTLGAGPNYAVDQPSYLRINFAAEQVNMWPRASCRPALVEGQGLSDWLGVASGEDEYPPRARVGEYLASGLQSLLAVRPANVSIETHRVRVEGLSRSGNAWSLNAASVDEVLLALGHAEAPIDGVFPVSSALSEANVAPGCTVAIRGFALTMIDACLALTEGRGGRFTDAGPGRLTYEPSAESPARIVPFSRTGRPILAKTGPAWVRARGLEEFPDRAKARAEAADGVAGLRVVISELAQELLFGMEAQSPGLQRPTAQAEIARSIDIATGQAHPDEQWALGHAWRSAYPAIVERFGRGALEGPEWPAFRALAREMERVAFGPPPINAMKLLALIEAEVVDLGYLGGALSERRDASELRDGENSIRVDAFVDAVLPPPGVSATSQPPVADLIDRGIVRTAAGRRGLELTGDVRCVSAEGEPVQGLGALGRPTEDWVIGNDTLSRTLHDEPDLWARRVVGDAIHG